MKRCLSIILLVFLHVLLITPACVADEGYSDDFRDSVEMEDSLLSENTDLNDPEAIKEDIDFDNIFNYIFRHFSGAFGEGIRVLIKGIAMVMLSVIISRCSGNIQNQNLQLLFSFILSLSLALMCESDLRKCAADLQASIENMSVFTAACIPSFTVVMISAGEGAGAGVFSGAMILLGEFGGFLSKSILLPLVDVYLAIGICSAVSDEYNFASIGRNIRRFVIWAVGGLVVLFRMIMRLQNGAASAGDQLTKKYIRSAVGSFIPMVGNTLSQGVDGLFAVATGVKTSFAIAGVLIILSVMLPALIRIGVYGMIWSLCRWIAEVMNDSAVRSIANVLSNCFYLMLALGGCVALMGLFSFFGLMTQVS